MRKLLTVPFCLSMGLSSLAQAAPTVLKGSDTLEDVTKDLISICNLSGAISYAGGGSGTGEAAMTSAPPTQQIAPMSRQLKAATAACTASSSQLLIGLDGIAVVAANALLGDSIDQTPGDPTDDCGDQISGGNVIAVPGCTTADGCDAMGNYTFTDWKDVLAIVYAGQNHTTAPQLLAGGARNPARIDCASTVRQTLVNDWGSIFTDFFTDPQACRTFTCLRLKHAFRRGDLSGTTDTFVSLVGLVPIPGYTTTSANNLPTKDSGATANPFCNAGEAVMNKGDSDYLDLDPIRRIADSDSASTLPTGRVGLEQVAAGYGAASNPPVVRGIDDRIEPPVTILADYAVSTEPNVLPDPTIPNSAALEKTALAARKGLGVVIPIEIPGNYNDERVAYFSTVPVFGEPVICSPGKFAPSFIDGQHTTTAMCPDGRIQPCLLPVNVDNPNAVNFNCLNNSPVPALPPLKDTRVYNLMVFDVNGKVVRDTYLNPKLTLSATRQSRVVSAFFRMHVSQVTDLGGFPTGINCKKFSSTDQIGCLVAANPCSIGFAGRESVDNFTNMAMRIEGLKATPADISNLVNGSGLPVYPLARPLWVNSVAGFSSVMGNERALLQCFQGTQPGIPLDLVDQVVASRSFVPVPAGVTRLKACPAVFP